LDLLSFNEYLSMYVCTYVHMYVCMYVCMLFPDGKALWVRPQALPRQHLIFLKFASPEGRIYFHQSIQYSYKVGKYCINSSFFNSTFKIWFPEVTRSGQCLKDDKINRNSTSIYFKWEILLDTIYLHYCIV
jgi:hypothetical protein